MTVKCGKPAMAIMVWPTMESVAVCADCINKAVKVATAMGFKIGIQPPPQGATCEQQLTDKR